MTTLITEEEECELDTIDISSIKLDIFALCKRNKRLKTYVELTQRLVAYNLQVLPINMQVFKKALTAIWNVYFSYNLSYHNDMHSLDVAQMTYVLL